MCVEHNVLRVFTIFFVFISSAMAGDFARLGPDFFVRFHKMFIARQIHSSVKRPLIKINSVKGAGPLKSQGPGQLPLLSCPSAVHCISCIHYY